MVCVQTRYTSANGAIYALDDDKIEIKFDRKSMKGNSFLISGKPATKQSLGTI